MKITKCPNCGLPKPTDEEFDNNTARMDYQLCIERGTWTWTCWECNARWVEKDNKIVEILFGGCE